MNAQESHGGIDGEVYDVAVVGYGPVGVAAANLLGRYGIRTVVLERDRDIYPRARAVTVNDWTMRIFQAMGLDDELKADMEENGALHWRTYGGREVFRVRRRDAGLGHPATMAIYQPVMEATLRRGVERYAGVVDVRYGSEVVDLRQDDDGVVLDVRDRESPTMRQVRARYALACDGGSSPTRGRLDVAMVGETRETTWIVVDAKVRRWWPGCKDLVFWTDPDRPVVDIPLALGHHRWEFPLRPGERPADFDSDEAVWRLLEPMGRTREELELGAHAFYSHHVRRAARWRVGRVLLLGDAAHLMPPWAGQGMQSGVRDAHNVVWKLREVLAGRLGPDLLDSYEAERAPQVAQVTALSEKMGTLISSADRRFVSVRDALGPLVMRVPALAGALMSTPPPRLGAGWVRGTPGRRDAVGRMLPQPPVGTADGLRVRLDDVLGDGFAVIGYDVDPRGPAAAGLAGWARLGARFVTVRPADVGARGGDDVVDDTGVLGAWMARHRATVVAVRPDRFVAATDTTGSAPPVPSGPVSGGAAAHPAPSPTL